MKRSARLFRMAGLLSALFCTQHIEAQIWKKILPEKIIGSDDQQAEEVLKQLRSDVRYLASDELEGRRTGTKGEALAGVYIERRMKDIGLAPFGTNYRRPFKFEWGRELTPEVRLTINGKHVNMPEDAFPFPFSSATTEENFMLPESMEANSPWLISLYTSEEAASNPHQDIEKEVFERAKRAQERGASAVLFYDQYGSSHAPVFNKNTTYESLDIPVLYLSKKVYDLHIKNMTTIRPVYIKTSFRKQFRSGTTRVGYLSNNAAHTVIIGAHYDHLGYGEDGNSRSTEKDKAVHNGADDNASGVAAMLALAQKIKQSGTRKYNYLFIAFSAEELGLLGSKAFVKEKDFDRSKAAYMINLDMVGRLNTERKLTIGGVGTSPSWGQVLPAINSGLKIVTDSSGVGPSDHATFYHDSIPVLFFFTGTHSDYHKPSDDAGIINYNGIKDIVNYVYNLTLQVEKTAKPAFSTTRNTVTGGRTHFKVTLGIMPDYSYQDGGVKIDGVIDDKPAAHAGLLQSDIILQIGEIKINGMQSYMEALGAFNPGEETKVKVKRGATVQIFSLKF